MLLGREIYCPSRGSSPDSSVRSVALLVLRYPGICVITNIYSKRPGVDKNYLIIFKHVWVVKTSVLSVDKADNFITSYVNVDEHVSEMF